MQADLIELFVCMDQVKLPDWWETRSGYAACGDDGDD